MRMIFGVLFALFIGASANAQTSTQSLDQPDWRDWKSSHNNNHPLVGLIHIPASKQPFDRKEKAQAFRLNLVKIWAVGVKFLLIGETHDNPDHHRIQAWFLNEIAKAKRRPSVVFEMVSRKYAEEITQFNIETDPQLDQFAKRLNWDTSGWPAWEIYRPIALAAARNNMRMVPGNLDKDSIRKISKQGLKVLSEYQLGAFGLTAKMSSNLRASLDEELKSSHCNLLPQSMIPTMRTIQRTRDGALADAMITSGNQAGAVLIAGNGHVRKDRGVPFVLRHRLPGFTERNQESATHGTIKVRTPRAHFLSIGLIEVQKGQNDPTDYGLVNAQGEALYDAVIFTPKANITDQCSALRKKFEKKKQ